MGEWKERPLILEEWSHDIDCVLAIDENGTTDMKSVLNPINDLLQWFTITGVMLNQENFVAVRNKFVELKRKYWENGLFNGRRVVFHSRDIRKRTGAFNPRIVDYQNFTEELDSLLAEMDYTIYSSSIDKFAHGRQYINPFPVYDLCLEFVLERFCHELRKDRNTGIIVMESRGRKENQILLNTAVNLLDKGNRFYSAHEFSRIKGVYFNPKLTTNKQLSFPQLELADLVSYPIHKFVRSDTKHTNFESIEDKLYNYPSYSGYGMKIFPNNSFGK